MVTGVVETTHIGPRWALLMVGSGVVATSIRKPAAVSLAGLVLTAGGAGVLSAARFAPDAELLAATHSVPRCRVAGEVADDAGGLGVLIRIDRLECSDGSISRGAVFVDDSSLVLGSSVTGMGTLVPLGDDPFGRARARYGAAGELVDPDLETSPPRSPWWRAAASVRRSLILVTRDLPEDAGALLRGLTIGDVDDVSPEVIASMKRAGLTHLVAVSGENVAIVLGVVSLLVTPLGHRVRVGILAAALAMFVLVVGPEASVLRAAAMGWIGLLGLVLGRRTEPLFLVGLAVLILVGFRPLLVGSAGFILSIAATIGIVLWASRVARWSRLPAAIALPVGVTTAAQVAVAPVLIVCFGQVSAVGIPANVLAAPAVPAATVLGFVAGAVGLVAPWAGTLVAAGAAPFAGWILFVARAFGSSPGATIALPAWVGLVAAVPILFLAVRSVALATGDNVDE